MLTGKVGSGKTTVCRNVTAGLHPRLYRVNYFSLTTGSVLDIYREIAWELSVPAEKSRATARQALRNDVLEKLRLLTNFAMDAGQCLCLTLVGFTELRRRLAMAMHKSLAQRLVVRHHLAGVDRDEVDAYVAHRLRLAGCELPLFDAAALDKTKTVTADHLEATLDELSP